MKRAARMMMAVGIGLVLTASAAFAADYKFSGFFGNPAAYEMLKPGAEGQAKLRWAEGRRRSQEIQQLHGGQRRLLPG